jgi:hypothetical protein
LDLSMPKSKYNQPTKDGIVKALVSGWIVFMVGFKLSFISKNFVHTFAGVTNTY